MKKEHLVATGALGTPREMWTSVAEWTGFGMNVIFMLELSDIQRSERSAVCRDL